jgi:hypothetical protein
LDDAAEALGLQLRTRAQRAGKCHQQPLPTDDFDDLGEEVRQDTLGTTLPGAEVRRQQPVGEEDGNVLGLEAVTQVMAAVSVRAAR